MNYDDLDRPISPEDFKTSQYDLDQLAAEAAQYDELQRQRDQDAPTRHLQEQIDELRGRLDALEAQRRQTTCRHEFDDRGRAEATCIHCGYTVYRVE